MGNKITVLQVRKTKKTVSRQLLLDASNINFYVFYNFNRISVVSLPGASQGFPSHKNVRVPCFINRTSVYPNIWLSTSFQHPQAIWFNVYKLCCYCLAINLRFPWLYCISYLFSFFSLLDTEPWCSFTNFGFWFVILINPCIFLTTFREMSSCHC